MFDLNEEILKWRSSLAKSDPLDEPAVDELESHLREEVESLASGNLSEEESFWLARRRLGGAGDLAGEFAKINRSTALKTRLFWMAAGALAYMLAIQSGVAASKLSVLLAILGGFRDGLGLISVVSQMVVLGTIFYFGCHVCAKVCGSARFTRWANDITGRISLFTALGVLVVLPAASRMLVVPVPGFIGVEEYGRLAIVSAYTQLALNLLLPLVMVLMMILLRRSRSDEIGA